jgi:hypothetical protein
VAFVQRHQHCRFRLSRCGEVEGNALGAVRFGPQLRSPWISICPAAAPGADDEARHRPARETRAQAWKFLQARAKHHDDAHREHDDVDEDVVVLDAAVGQLVDDQVGEHRIQPARELLHGCIDGQ